MSGQSNIVYFKTIAWITKISAWYRCYYTRNRVGNYCFFDLIESYSHYQHQCWYDEIFKKLLHGSFFENIKILKRDNKRIQNLALAFILQGIMGLNLFHVNLQNSYSMSTCWQFQRTKKEQITKKWRKANAWVIFQNIVRFWEK